jgi:hypothetical protein
VGSEQKRARKTDTSNQREEKTHNEKANNVVENMCTSDLPNISHKNHTSICNPFAAPEPHTSTSNILYTGKVGLTRQVGGTRPPRTGNKPSNSISGISRRMTKVITDDNIEPRARLPNQGNTQASTSALHYSSGA